jgi:hypothetical protein
MLPPPEVRRAPGRSLALAALSAAAIAGCAPAAEPDAEAAEAAAALAQRSSALADRFQKTLQAELQAAMAEGGPEGAIGVCADRAPAIAAELSAESGAIVRRTSFRNRNPDAAPTAAEAQLMRAWLDSPLGPDRKPRVASLANPDGQPGAHLWMRAIPTGGQCLACHGPAEAIAEDVRAAIKARYPADRATGFAEGELRGAFSIRWPASHRAAGG